MRCFSLSVIGQYSSLQGSLGRTKSRVQHVQSHLVALLGPGNCHQPLVAALLRFVDLDHTSAEMSDLVDLGSSLSDDRTDHVVRDEDLLGERLTRHGAASGASAGIGSTLLRGLGSSVRRGLGTAASIGGMGSTTIRHGGLTDRRGCGLTMHIGDAVRATTSTVGVRVMPFEGIRMTILTTGRLGNIRNHLHAAGHSPSRTTAPCSVSRGSRSTETLSELLDQGHGNVVRSNVNSIRNTKDNKRALSRQRKASIRRIETRSRRLLNFANAATTLTDDGPN